MTALRLGPPDAGAFAPFGRLVAAPADAGARAQHGEALRAHAPGTAPALHVNHVAPSRLPLAVAEVERHPHAAQCFFPLDVARYVVLVMPSGPDGRPDPGGALGFLMPPESGVIYAPGTWHMGATVLERPGAFVVLMWRGSERDDEFAQIAPLTLLGAAS